MGQKRPRRGGLIALEGTRGQDLREAARRLWRELERNSKAHGGVSQWDASGTFYEMQLGKRKTLVASPRTLILLYASDLVFRLRWEIRPAMESGQSVIAAPYLETVIAFALANGVPRKWLTEVFTFAPKPQACYRIKERKKGSGWKGKPTDGYLEFCSKVLSASSPSWDPHEARKRVIDHLAAVERRRGCRRLTKKRLTEVSAVL